MDDGRGDGLANYFTTALKLFKDLDIHKFLRKRVALSVVPSRKLLKTLTELHSAEPQIVCKEGNITVMKMV